jgi:NADPH:quinone reductase-like Zn-dependent oxidoreductase
VRRETRFAIASVTKPFVAGLVVQLAAAGILGLDDPLSRWMPRFPGARRITLAAQLAASPGATVIGTVRRGADLARVDDAISNRVALDELDPVGAIRGLALDGVDRIVEVSFSDNADLDAAVAAPPAVIAAYATRDPRPGFDCWPMLFANLTIRLLGSDDFPATAKQPGVVGVDSFREGVGRSVPEALHDQATRRCARWGGS